MRPSSSDSAAAGAFRFRFIVPPEVIDQNGHVNNVAYVQWMQEVAIRHSEDTGGSRAMRAAGGTWVVRSHQIEYLSPAHSGDQIEAVTWVASFHRVRSVRQYRFVRLPDARLLARGATEWVFVSAKDGRPRAIPSEVKAAFLMAKMTDSPENTSLDKQM
jgi:acyl-CoA thioester hydrolase